MPEMTLELALAEGARHEGAMQWEQAEAIYRGIAAQAPACAEALGRLAFLARRAGRKEEAVDWLHRAAAARPDVVEYIGNLGVALAEMRRFDDAAEVFARAVKLWPDDAVLHLNLGNVLNETRQWEKAVHAYGTAARLKPDHPGVHFGLGNALWEMGRNSEAIEAQSMAIALKPDYAQAYQSLGNVLLTESRLDEALAAFARAVELRPTLGEAYTGMGAVYQATARANDALACYRRAAELSQRAGIMDGLLVTMHSDPAHDAQALFAEHDAWNRRYARPLDQASRRHENDASADRRIRVGYVSAYLNEKPVGRFLSPLLTHHDRHAFDVFCYSDVKRGDAMTQTLRASADIWRDTARLSDEQLAQLIVNDRIDILIDLGMHTKGNRMMAFARKPAPVQVTYLAYCGTTGLETMDYRISDPYLDPTDADQPFYSERTVRLESYWCYPPPSEAPEVSGLPASRNGYATFGCLNDFSKVSEATLAMWGEILGQMDGSRFVLHSPEGSHRDRLLDTMRRWGIKPERIEFVSMLPAAKYFAKYHDIDIALDPTPWCGGTTTCDALWMGVAVVSLAGRTAISRGGASLLSQVGLVDWIARDPKDYVRIAWDAVRNLDRMRYLRSHLREQMRGSRLMNAAAFTHGFESALRGMWSRWCESRA